MDDKLINELAVKVVEDAAEELLLKRDVRITPNYKLELSLFAKHLLKAVDELMDAKEQERIGKW